VAESTFATSLPLADIKTLIAQLTRTNVNPKGYPVIWDGEPRPFVGQVGGKPGAWIELDIGSYRSRGVDDYRQTYDPATLTQSSAMVGLRQFTLTLDCRSYDGDTPSFDILEVVRLRLNNPHNVTARRALQAACLSIAKIQPMVELTEKADSRFVWRSAIDVVFNWTSNDIAADDGGEIIATVATVAGKPNPISPLGTNVITGQLNGGRLQNG
jgi:hypothetical protein